MGLCDLDVTELASEVLLRFFDTLRGSIVSVSQPVLLRALEMVFDAEPPGTGCEDSCVDFLGRAKALGEPLSEMVETTLRSLLDNPRVAAADTASRLKTVLRA